MSKYSGENANETFNLKAGTYYIGAVTYDMYSDDKHIPAAKFKISEVKPEMSCTKTETGVTYSISGSIPEVAQLYAAIYDGGILKEIKQIENPASEGSISFKTISATDSCKLFLWDTDFAPLCGNVTCN